MPRYATTLHFNAPDSDDADHVATQMRLGLQESDAFPYLRAGWILTDPQQTAPDYVDVLDAAATEVLARVYPDGVEVPGPVHDLAAEMVRIGAAHLEGSVDFWDGHTDVEVPDVHAEVTATAAAAGWRAP